MDDDITTAFPPGGFDLAKFNAEVNLELRQITGVPSGVHEAWRLACKQIIDRCVPSDMYGNAMALLDKAYNAAVERGR